MSLGAGLAGPVPDLPEEVRGPWDPRVRVFRAGPEVDAHAVVTERCVVLVDTMSTPGLARGMLDALAPDLPGRALVVVNTHQHHDHTWGNAAVVPPDGPGLPILAHPRGLAVAEDPVCRAFLVEQQAAEARFAGGRLVPPTVAVPDGTRVDGGDLTVVLLHTPGHTRDHLAAWIPEIRVLLPGDAAEHPFPYAEAPGDVAALEASLVRMAALGPAWVLPAHGGTSDPGLLDRNISYIREVRRRAPALRSARPGAEGQAGDGDPFPYTEALEFAGADPHEVPDLYRDFHRQNLANAGPEPGS